jgi:Fe-S-cluster containining protein
MKNFTPIDSNSNYGFSNCDSCEANCCDGAKGSIYAQILLEDFDKVYKNFPILFIKGDLSFIKPVILLSDGVNHCRYIQNYRCSIYDDRPSICRAYPLSPNLDNSTYIDQNCPAINEYGNNIVANGSVTNSFLTPILQNYQEKYIQTHLEIDQYNSDQNLEHILSITDTEFFKINIDVENKYIKMHQESLKNLSNIYFKSIDINTQ